MLRYIYNRKTTLITIYLDSKSCPAHSKVIQTKRWIKTKLQTADYIYPKHRLLNVLCPQSAVSLDVMGMHYGEVHD